jgi:hypothetical protein
MSVALTVRSKLNYGSNRLQYVGYWTKCPVTYGYVVVYEYVFQNRETPHASDYFKDAVSKTTTYESAVAKAEKAETSRGIKAWIITRDTYNNLINQFKNDILDKNFDMNELVVQAAVRSNNMLSLRGKMVYVVWNMTQGSMHDATESMETAMKSATDHAKQQPTHEMVVLAPAKKVYQPVQIEVEDIKLG